jgi:pyridoxal phosphate enzyme (YggS family)
VDSFKLLNEINRRSGEVERQTDVLLQVHIAKEETKSGLDMDELRVIMESVHAHPLPHVRIRGLMGMATFTDDLQIVRREFKGLKALFDEMKKISGNQFDTLSMGMSGDYKIALDEGSTMVRIGSLLFGSRK